MRDFQEWIYGLKSHYPEHEDWSYLGNNLHLPCNEMPEVLCDFQGVVPLELAYGWYYGNTVDDDDVWVIY